jgi:hypothetical protein
MSDTLSLLCRPAQQPATLGASVPTAGGELRPRIDLITVVTQVALSGTTTYLTSRKLWNVNMILI